MPGEGNPPPISVEMDSATAIYRQFFFRGTHNSYSGNLGGMRREGIETQLDMGLRFFEFDLFSFYTQQELLTTWAEETDNFAVFEYDEEIHILSYTKTSGVLKIDKLTNSVLERVYQNTNATLKNASPLFSTMFYGNRMYVLAYESVGGHLTVYDFNGTELNEVLSENLGVNDADLWTFVFNDQAYVSIRAFDDATFTIRKININKGAMFLGNPLYEQNSIPIADKLYPFEQNDKLYIFKHNVNTITNFEVVSVNTDNINAWAKSENKKGTSDLLKGNVQASWAKGRLYLNSYVANGYVIGCQLIMDNNTPNIVYEYNNENDMISGAESGFFPSSKGFYLFLRKGTSIQISSIGVSQLTLGHDAPGDEVDLSVDNPQSIFLEDWIASLAAWSDKNADHEPLFIMTELKEYEQWIADSKWQNIIGLMKTYFGDKLRYHSSDGFHNEPIVEKNKIIDGKSQYFMDKNGSKQGGLLGKVILYIQPNNNITKSTYTNNFVPFSTSDGQLQKNYLQLRRYRENNKLVSPDWRSPHDYGNNIGAYINSKDDSYISRIFHMQDDRGNGQYDNIRCTDVMFAVSDKPFQGLYLEYVDEQKVKNKLENVVGCE